MKITDITDRALWCGILTALAAVFHSTIGAREESEDRK
jgi:hypothetical protein